MARSLAEIESDLARVTGEMKALGDIMETATRRFRAKVSAKADLDIERYHITGTVMCPYCGKDSLPGQCSCLELLDR